MTGIAAWVLFSGAMSALIVPSGRATAISSVDRPAPAFSRESQPPVSAGSTQTDTDRVYVIDSTSPFTGLWSNARENQAVVSRIEVLRRGPLFFATIWGNCNGCDWGEQPVTPIGTPDSRAGVQLIGTWSRSTDPRVSHVVRVTLTISGTDLLASFLDNAATIGGAAAPASTERFVRRADLGLHAPVPINKATPSYTSAAMRAKVEGHVRVEGIVEIDGTLSAVKVVQSLDREFGLDEEAVKAARQWRFRPATNNGVKVRALVVIEVEFRIKTDPVLPSPLGR